MHVKTLSHWKPEKLVPSKQGPQSEPDSAISLANSVYLRFFMYVLMCLFRVQRGYNCILQGPFNSFGCFQVESFIRLHVRAHYCLALICSRLSVDIYSCIYYWWLMKMIPAAQLRFLLIIIKWAWCREHSDCIVSVELKPYSRCSRLFEQLLIKFNPGRKWLKNQNETLPSPLRRGGERRRG